MLSYLKRKREDRRKAREHQNIYRSVANIRDPRVRDEVLAMMYNN